MSGGDYPLESLDVPPPKGVQKILEEQRQAAGAPDLSWVDDLLRGIDKDECEDDTGWWETSTGADFGKSKLAELKREIVRRYHSPSADTDSANGA